MNNKKEFTELLVNTKREGIENLLTYMEKEGFFTSPCSTRYHLACEGGLCEHSLNVYHIMKSVNDALKTNIFDESIVICALLHDLGKMGDYGKRNYLPNVLKSGKVSEAEPYQVNKNLSSIPHEVRSISIARRFIRLTEAEEDAIIKHNGLYGNFKNEIQGKETALYLMLHFADMWASRIIEK